MTMITIPADKKGHLVLGAVVATLVLVYGPAVQWVVVQLLGACPLLGTPMQAALAAGAVGVAKEVWDSLGHGTVDFLDYLATQAGGLAVAGVYLAWSAA